ncbi:MAG: DUF2232 domain-containing protein [Clostridium sp.]|nr:DUF2232 domain-containing protein [Clostridium sp.]
MDVKKLTTAAILSAAFVVSSVIFIGMGLGYLGYIDFIVPVFIAMICLKCDVKYSILASITCAVLITFVIGDISSAIMMIQSMILGIIIGIAINRKSSILDDLFYCSICACFLIILMDINFSSLTGYSLLRESQEYLKYVPVEFEYIKDVVLYMTIAVLPLGTVILCYILTLILGMKFKMLEGKSITKAAILLNYKKYGTLVSCSRNTIYAGITWALVSVLLNNITFITQFTYLKIIINCTLYIVLFFLIQDSLSMINKYVFLRTRSRSKLLLMQMTLLISLLNFFRIAILFMVVSSFIIERKYKIKYREEIMIDKVIDNLTN